eukprot:3919255-Alexandrium_andersonii.AAC.1
MSGCRHACLVLCCMWVLCKYPGPWAHTHLCSRDDLCVRLLVGDVGKGDAHSGNTGPGATEQVLHVGEAVCQHRTSIGPTTHCPLGHERD